VKGAIFRFVRDERAQDMVEYALLLAFVAIASAALFIGSGDVVSAIWRKTNSRLTNVDASII
jgi:Flp pilus assembly pilin Flp